MERIICCNKLLTQADGLVHGFHRVARTDIPLAERQTFADTYREWYMAGQAVILDELRAHFEAYYITSIDGFSSIQDLLTRLTSDIEADVRYLWLERGPFKWMLEE